MKMENENLISGTIQGTFDVLATANSMGVITACGDKVVEFPPWISEASELI